MSQDEFHLTCSRLHDLFTSHGENCSDPNRKFVDELDELAEIEALRTRITEMTPSTPRARGIRNE